MQVSFNPVNYNKNYSFKASNVSSNETPAMPTAKQITNARMKKSVSECFFVALGVGVTYFMLKVKGKKHQLAKQAKKNEELKKILEDLVEPILPTAANVQKVKG